MMRVVTVQVVDMQSHQGVIDKALEEFVNQINVKISDQRSDELHAKLQTRTPGEIHHYARQRFIQRHIGVAIAYETFFVADRFRYRLPQRNASANAGTLGGNRRISRRVNPFVVR